MSRLTLSVPEIHCDNCKASIEKAVSPLDGVQDVAVDVGERTVAVAYAEPADLATISAAITSAGFDVAAIVEDDERPGATG